ncbi:hypothetical protein [Streptomyces sp. NBC_01314]|uniref:hypothetical protein n=1 Tax=Streptomyces sp. NBC_01314 TaxID=2903821 RepID=UPI00308C42CF|nr:helix-turn-helix domain-containing protein [Streptomyces sp. NBC_01314]
MQRQSPRPPSARALPSRRTRADQHLAAVRAFCLTEGPFTARSLEALAGVPATRIQLSLSFWRSCGLVERAPGRGAYRHTRTARSLAVAWRQGDAQGSRALGGILRGQWFARSVRSRLLDGPGLRTALVTRLMRLAQVGDEYRLEVEMLIDLMVAVDLLQPQPDSRLSWREEASPMSEPADAPDVTSAEDESSPEDSSAASEAHAAGSPDSPGEPAPEDPRPEEFAAKVPPPRAASDDSLLSLLSHPVRLIDLASLSAEELLSVHGHITALAAAATKLRSRPSPHPTD